MLAVAVAISRRDPGAGLVRLLNGALIVGTERGGVDSTLGVRRPLYAAPAFADLRGPGAPDLFAGGAGGGIVYYRR